MENYRNFGGNSGVAAFKIEDNSITVTFTTGSVYLYTYSSAGPNNIEQMKSLAKAGQGLNSFIMRNVKTKYEAILS